MGLATAFWFRRETLDALMSLVRRSASGRAWQSCVLTTPRLVERRSRWVGCPRPSGQTVARWYGQLLAAVGEVQGDLNRLVRPAGWVLSAPERSEARPPWDERDIRWGSSEPFGP